MAINDVFKKATEDYPDFKMGENLEEIVVDFSDAESNGFRDAIGNKLADKLLRGCHVCPQSLLAIYLQNTSFSFPISLLHSNNACLLSKR